MIPLILHIPHASTVIPGECRGEFVVDDEALSRHLAVSTDHFTDELFAMSGPEITSVVFPISRLVVDPERFEDDRQETMASRGLGVLYERGHDGTRIRSKLPPERRRWYLDRWYYPHHAALDSAVTLALERHGAALIIDCHSYPEIPLAVDLHQSVPRPDGCFGTSDPHTPRWLVEAGLRFATEHAWTFAVNEPYAGTMVPMRYFGRDPRVLSVMIEINRGRYMTLTADEARRTEGFVPVRGFVQGLITALRTGATAGSVRGPIMRL